MSDRYEHETGQHDDSFCKHCHAHKGAWPDSVCKLKPPALEDETLTATATLLNAVRRDRFAMAAMTGLLAANSHPESSGNAYTNVGPIEDLAEAAYRYADAMEAARDV